MRGATLVLLIASVAGIDSARAVDAVSIAETCIRSFQTYSCGEAFTQISSSEANIFTAIEVSGTFLSPGGPGDPGTTIAASKNVVSWNPFTWKVRVEKSPVYCAWSGYHETVGNHVLQFPGSPVQLPSSSSYYRPYCDCGSSPP
jgi:hypothetical protein